MGEEPRIAITISKQMGSGGSYIGHLVAKELGFKYIDREILHEAATRLGTDASVLEAHDERSCGFIDSLVRAFSFGTPEAAYVPPLSRPVYDKDLFTLESRIMNEIVDRYSAVIAGRAGFHVLRQRPGVIRVFVHAPTEFRVQRVMQVQHAADISGVRAQVEESDRRRSKFVRDMVGVNWADARNYHLCIDSSAVGFPTAAEMVIKMATEKLRTGAAGITR